MFRLLWAEWDIRTVCEQVARRLLFDQSEGVTEEIRSSRLQALTILGQEFVKYGASIDQGR